MSYTFIEVCSGCGGLSSGLIQAGFTAKLLNDNDKNCCKTLIKNHPNINIKQCSLETIDVASVPLSVHFPAENLRINFFSSSRSNAASSALCSFKFERLSMALIPTALPEFSSKKRSMNWSLIGSDGLSCFLFFFIL